MDKEVLMRVALDAGLLGLRNVWQKDEKPFLYSSGNFGPGYIYMGEILAGNKKILRPTVYDLHIKVLEELRGSVEVVAGVETGGYLPGWELSNYLERSALYHDCVHYIQVRKEEKSHGSGGRLVGARFNKKLRSGARCLVVDEVINFAQNSGGVATHLKKTGFYVSHVACVLDYENPQGHQRLADVGVKPISLFTLKELLVVAEEMYDIDLAALFDYRVYLNNPKAWQKKYLAKNPKPKN